MVYYIDIKLNYLLVYYMMKVKSLQEKAKLLSSNNNVIQALVSYFLVLSWHPDDYETATTEASYELDTCDINEFKSCIQRWQV